MPARAALAINDGQGTPVSHTFSPVETADHDLFEDRSGGIPIGYPLIVYRCRRPPKQGQVSDANRVYRIETNVSVPIMEVTSPSTGTGIQPAPTVAYICRHNGTWFLPERSTLQDRKNLRAYVANLYNHAEHKKVVEDLDFWW